MILVPDDFKIKKIPLQRQNKLGGEYDSCTLSTGVMYRHVQVKRGWSQSHKPETNQASFNFVVNFYQLFLVITFRMNLVLALIVVGTYMISCEAEKKKLKLAICFQRIIVN